MMRPAIGANDFSFRKASVFPIASTTTIASRSLTVPAFTDTIDHLHRLPAFDGTPQLKVNWKV
jgi:hypothetical protein